ncbi:MAG TPA: nuclear transport factor 2 family protein [Allosphingosinicella sp.]|nr:nuclear transport factor 2 family protein [Allosphingosinicella sp.]
MPAGLMRSLPIALLVTAGEAPARRPDRDAATQVVRAYHAALATKDFSLLRAVTWPEGSFCWYGPPRRCQAFGDLSENFLGGFGVFHRTRYSDPEIRAGRNRVTIWVNSHTRTYYDDEFSGMSSQARLRFVVTPRRGQWRIQQISTVAFRPHGSDADWHRRHPG